MVLAVEALPKVCMAISGLRGKKNEMLIKHIILATQARVHRQDTDDLFIKTALPGKQ